jgi:hypothetical protein
MGNQRSIIQEEITSLHKHEKRIIDDTSYIIILRENVNQVEQDLYILFTISDSSLAFYIYYWYFTKKQEQVLHNTILSLY